MHAGFKGNRLGIVELTLRENTINYTISFIDSEGVTHGTMRHARGLTEGSDINTKVDALVTALLNEASAMHYASPANAPSKSDLATSGAPLGLGETMGTTPKSPDEPEGTPG